MQSTRTRTYSSLLSGKGALVAETLAVLQQIDLGHSLSEVKAMVMDDGLLGKTTMSTRGLVWEQIHARYLGDEAHARTLARLVTHAPDRQTGRLALFYELCRSLPILHDTTIRCVYPRYVAGYSSIAKADIYRYFDDLAPEHPELTAWSPQTREKVVSNILTVLRDFGLLAGSQQKQFARLYVPLPAFVYVLYRLVADGLTTPQELLAHEDWRIFFLETADVVTLLDEATAAGHCTFKHQGNIYSLDLHYPSLEVCVATLTRQV